MIGFGILLIWAGYSVGSYGWVLVEGFNITPREWFSPLAPYTWPAPGTDIPKVPKGHIFPTSSADSTAAAARHSTGGNPIPNVD